ncbi:MAG: hypothetical protein HRF43_19390 [Phycisphaerae bacterium]|jgi:hypothetical protein
MIRGFSFSGTARVLILAAMTASPLAAKEKKDKDVNATIKLYEENTKTRKAEQKLKMVCKTDNGRIVAPATFSYTVDPEGACEVSPASGTASKTGELEFTFKYKKAGTCKVTFKCGDEARKLVVAVESLEKPKKVYTEHEDQIKPAKDPSPTPEPPKDAPKGSDGSGEKPRKPDGGSQKTLRLIETQNALAAAYFEALARQESGLADDAPLSLLMSLIVGLELLQPVDPPDVGAALAELEQLAGVPSLVPEMFPATELLLDLYSQAVMRYFQSTDCNGSGLPDYEDLANGVSNDLNGNFVPDDCDCRAVIFDADDDQDVDQSDFGAFQNCLTGPNVTAEAFNALPLACRCMDVTGAEWDDPDGAVDRHDLESFASCVTGPAMDPAFLDPHCDGW